MESRLKKTSLKYLKHLHLSRKQAAHPKFLKATHQLKTEPMVNIIDSIKMNNFVIWWTEVSFLLPKSKVNRFEIMPDRTVFLLTELSFFLDETEVSFNVLFFSSKGNFFRRLFFAISFFLWPFNHMASFSSKRQFSLECFHLKNCTPQSFECAPLTV